MHATVKYILCFLSGFVIFSTLRAAAQEKKSLFGELTEKNCAIIRINGGCERGFTSEIDIIYWSTQDTGTYVKYKIHSVLRGNTFNIDTIFYLNKMQMAFLNQFETEVRNGTIKSDGLIIAGCYTKYDIAVGDNKEEMENKMEYSVLKKLIWLK